MTSSLASIFKSCSQLFFYTIIMLGLVACGFQLRGAIDISDDVAPVYINQNTVFELGREIKSLLATNKIKVVEEEDLSKSKLVLVNETKKRSVLSVDGTGRAKEYLFTYTVNFTTQIKQSKEVVDKITISRSLVFEPEAVLAMTNQEAILYKDMQREAARLILLKLQALSRKDAQQNTVKGDAPVQTGADATP
jgi:LPS-assembly lipoprotein